MSHPADEHLWRAPWPRGSVTTQRERDDYAQQAATTAAAILDLAHLSRARDARCALWMAYHAVFASDEFREWFQAENEEHDRRESRAREVKRRQNRDYRRRRKEREQVRKQS